MHFIGDWSLSFKVMSEVVQVIACMSSSLLLASELYPLVPVQHGCVATLLPAFRLFPVFGYE